MTHQKKKNSKISQQNNSGPVTYKNDKEIAT